MLVFLGLFVFLIEVHMEESPDLRNEKSEREDASLDFDSEEDYITQVWRSHSHLYCARLCFRVELLQNWTEHVITGCHRF